MTWFKKINNVKKYKNESTFYGGNHYDSKAEANYAVELDLRKKSGDIKDWERQINFPIYHKGKLITTPRIDFLIHHIDGMKEFVEVKSPMTASLSDYRIKRKLIEAELDDDKNFMPYRVEVYKQFYFKKWRS